MPLSSRIKLQSTEFGKYHNIAILQWISISRFKNFIGSKIQLWLNITGCAIVNPEKNGSELPQ
ncbi:MAG TPA: hypothetical protein EYG38_16840 [Verrucomicrobia bacterium]|nr:hypothetical protein [Verrucomicrobiota bacterium]